MALPLVHASRSLTLLLAMLAASPAAAYVLRRDSTGAVVRWEGPVKLVVDERLERQLRTEGARAAVEAALETVAQAAGGLTLELVPGTARGVGYDVKNPSANQSELVVPAHWEYEPGYLAVTVVTMDKRTHTIIDADIALNAHHRTFRVLAPGSAAGGEEWDDVQNTVTHELGHAVGLAHNPEVPESVMYPAAEFRETSKRTLSADDVAGLAFLYGGPVARGEQEELPVGCASVPTAPLSAALLLLAGVLRPRHRRLKPRTAPAGAAALLTLGGALTAAASAPQRTPPDLERAAVVLTGRVVRVQTLAPTEGTQVLRSEVEVELAHCYRGACPRRLVLVRPGGSWGALEQRVEGLELPRGGEHLGVVLEQGEEAPGHAPSSSRVYNLSRTRDLVAFARGLERLQAHASAPTR
jgi:hypothetical protein